MTYILSNSSFENLSTCCVDLKRVVIAAIKTSPIDFSVICGFRDKEAQELAFRLGHSKLHFPLSSHNKNPSLAVDIIPYPSGYKDIYNFQIMGAHILLTAHSMGIKLCWGGFWCEPKDYPCHDWASNGADAFSTFSLQESFFGQAGVKGIRKNAVNTGRMYS